MAIKFKYIKSKIRLLANALFPRLFFILHGLLITDLLVWQTDESKYLYLLICLGVIVFEGLFNVIVRDGKEFHWVCPSALLYCVVLIGVLTVLRLTQMESLNCQLEYGTNYGNCSLGIKRLSGPGVSITEKIFNGDFSSRISFVEQSGMAALILGRWLLPKGSIPRDQFLQIVLIYIGTAADILELSEIYEENIIDMPNTKDVIKGVYYGTISVWALGISQFGITIALPEEGLKKEEEVETNDDDGKTAYLRSKFPNKVAPMSYMHYKSMLRERARLELNKPVRDRSSDSSSRETDISRPRSIPQTPKLKSQDDLSKENIRSSFPNVNSVGAFRPRRVTLHSSRESSPGSRETPPFADSLRTPKRKYSASVLSNKSNNSLKDITLPHSDINLSNGSTKKARNLWRRVVTKHSVSKFMKGNKRKIRHDSETEDNKIGVGKEEVKSCFMTYIGLIEMLQPVCMQDGPFFILRAVFLIHFKIMTDMTFLLLGKNLLVIIIQVYRILLMYCVQPHDEEDIDMDDPSNRVRFATESNRRLSQKNVLKTRQEYLAMRILGGT